MPANCMCACVCVPHPAASPHSAFSACGCTHLCADLSGGTWLPPPPLFFFFFFVFFHHHIMWRRGRAAMHSSHAQQPCTAEQIRQ